MRYAIGVDFGGTNTKIALVSEKGLIIEKGTFPTPNPFNKEKWLLTLESWVKERQKTHESKEIMGIGVGIAGLVSPADGVVKHAPNVKGIDGWAMKDSLEKIFPTAIAIDNDVNAVALGEIISRGGRDKDAVVITLGTGVGGGLILNGEIYRGAHFMAGELGHMTINESGPICNCGNEGCAESYLGNQRIIGRFKEILREGGTSIVTEMVENLEDITPQIVCEAAEKGDPLALKLWEKVAKHLGTLLANIVNLLNPSKIIIGGGVAGAFDLIEKNIWATLEKRALKASLEGLVIEKSALGSDAGVIGAASLVIREGEQA